MDFGPTRIIRAMAERGLPAVIFFHIREQNPVDSTSTTRFGRWAPVPVRMVVGYAFVFHGYAKLVRGPEHFVVILHALGVPMPELMGWITIIVELVGGLAILMGAFARWVSIPLSAILLVSIFWVLLPNGFTSIKLAAITSAGIELDKPGYEIDLLYLACLTMMVLGGTGPLSLDRFFAERKSIRRRNLKKLINQSK